MNSKEIWLEKGYEFFAWFGPGSLTINKVAKEINQTRTSFYYYFNDLTDFINELIRIHLKLFEIYLEKAKKECNQYSPDTMILLSEFSMGLRFHKQLFNNRNNPLYNFIYMQCNDRSADAFAIDLFEKYYKLDTDKSTLKLIHESLLDAWFSKLDINHITVESMVKLSDAIMESILVLIKKPINPYQIHPNNTISRIKFNR